MHIRRVPPLIDDDLVNDMGYLDYHIRAHGHERTMPLPARRMARQQLQQQQHAGDAPLDAAEDPPEARNIAAGVAVSPPNLHDAADQAHANVAVATAETEMHVANNNTQPHNRKRPYADIDEGNDSAEKHHA